MTISIKPTASGSTIEQDGSTILTVDGSGNITAENNFTSANIPTANSIYLGGTLAANLLDDYEYGTWTPVVSGSTSAGSGTYSTQTGAYVKIGKQVIAQCFVRHSNTHSGTGAFKVSLPFTAAPNTSSYGGATVSYKESWVTNGPDLMQVEANTAFGYLRADNNTGMTDLNPASVTQNNTAFMLIINYQVA